MSVSFITNRRVFRAFAVGITLWSSGASAYPTYPSGLRDGLNMSCTPSCTVCHESDPGLGSNASKPFRFALQEADPSFPGSGDQQEAFDAARLLPANVNSDDDDRSDKEELQSDPPTDPNFGVASDPVIYGENICAGVVEYGCGAHMASRPRGFFDGAWGWGLFGLTLGLVVAVRRRARRYR